MSKQDFNISPYYDDFDPSKNYLKILYRSGRPVQARELNQTQSILQRQIENFANHIFKNGSKVSNARTALQSKAYVRLIGSPNVQQYPENTQLVGETSGITATLVRGVNVENDDPATLYVVYTGTAIDGSTSSFIPGENIRIRDENEIEIGVVTVRCPSCPGSGLDDVIEPTGRGQFFTVDEGIFYFEGMFIETPRQEIIVQKYLTTDEDGNIDNFEPCKIGLDFVQTIVTHVEDNSLLDPSLGYPNSTAPGADRYKAELILVRREYNDEDGENFIPLVRLGEDMRIEFMKSDSDYSNLMDTIAKRTYETNGDYTVRPFRVSFMNSKKNNATDPHGWSMNGDDDSLVAVVSPSVAYVKGYRVETVDDTPVRFPKARDTKQMSSFVKHFDGRTYILGRPMGASIWPNASNAPSTVTNSVVQIYNGDATQNSVNGSVIGNFKVSDIEYVSGDLSTNTAIYRYYIYDLNMAAGQKLSSARSFVSAGANFYTNAVPDSSSNQVEVYNANRTALIYRLNRDNVKTLRANDDPLSGSVNIVMRKKMSGVADGSGTVTFTTATNEYFDNAGSGFVGWYVQGGTTTSFHAPTVSTLSPTSLTVDLGAGGAGASVYVIVDVLRTNQTEKLKTPQNLTYLTNVAPSANLGSEIHLGVADAYRLRSVKVFVAGSPDVEVADITDEYVLDSNISDIAYLESKIRRVAPASFTFGSTHRLAINFDYYQHSGSQGYFTIDSYAPALNSSDSGVTYETLGEYISDAGDVYPIASSIDFRPVIIGNNAINALLPANASTSIFDIEYYLARADILQINKDGVLYVKPGEPSETPAIPRTDDNAMKLYEIWLKPYTYSLKDVSTKYIDNRRYTMRDIGALEKRLTNVEYITALNVLEKSAADMSIKDENGLDRYKNGFIADNFQDFQAADLQAHEFRASADREQRQLRPAFKASNRKLKFAPEKSSGFHLMGNVATRPFTESVSISQPYATKHISINPYLQYNQSGELVLSPNNDVWTSETELPNVIIDVDSGVEDFTQLAEAAGVLGTDWGSWVDQNRTILQTTQTSDVLLRGQPVASSTTTVTSTAVTQARTGTSTTVESRVSTYNIDDIVKDIQIIPFIRSRDVEFYATKMKPNTRVYAFFDGTPVSEFCRDIGFQLSADNASTATQLVEFGSPLITDSNGELRGVFRIPANRFFVGEKKFVLSDDPKLSGDGDMQTTSADAVYFAGGLDVTKQDVTLNVITPSFQTAQVSETQTRTEVTASRESTPVVSNIPPERNAPCAGLDRGVELEICGCAAGLWTSRFCADPIAQAFIADEEMFVSGIDLFFRQVDVFSDRIFVQIRNMVNGYPGTTVIAQKNYTPDQIQPFCSDDSSTAFRVNFDTPVFIEGNTQYCFVVGGFSPNSRMWVARLGEEVVNMPGKIVEMPATTESSFRSLNGSTWNAEQFEQIKFELRRAVFEPGTMELVFENDHEDEVFNLEPNPFQTQVGQTRVRVFHKNHGFTVADRVSLSLFEYTPFLIEMADFVPQIGQKMHTVTGSGIIADIKSHTVANQYYVTLKNVSGIMTAGQTYTCDALVKGVRDWYIISSMDTRKPQTYTLNQCTGTVRENNYSSRYPTGSIAGIPISEFNTEHASGSLGHSIIEVDSIDSYIINVQTPATMTGRFGGDNIVAYNGNEKYEVFNVSGAYIPYRAAESWTFTGIGHGEMGGLFESSNYQTMQPIRFQPQQDRYLGQPYKIASQVNEQIMLAGDKSISVKGTFSSSSTSNSPVINLDTFSVTTVSNRVEWQDKEARESIPVGEPHYVPEQDMVNGTEVYKYVTKTVNLAQPASDLYIYVDVYKDLNADFDVYVKRMTQHDSGSIDQHPWMKVTGLQKNRSSVDLSDFIEYSVIASQHIVPYTEGGVTYPGWDDSDPFVSFKVKLVGKSRNTAKPPLFRALRIIAVT